MQTEGPFGLTVPCARAQQRVGLAPGPSVSLLTFQSLTVSICEVGALAPPLRRTQGEDGQQGARRAPVRALLIHAASGSVIMNHNY